MFVGVGGLARRMVVQGLSGCLCRTRPGPTKPPARGQAPETCWAGGGARPPGLVLLWDSPLGKREMRWPQMSAGDLAADFGSPLKAFKECRYRDNSCTKPVTKKSPVAALILHSGR